MFAPGAADLGVIHQDCCQHDESDGFIHCGQKASGMFVLQADGNQHHSHSWQIRILIHSLVRNTVEITTHLLNAVILLLVDGPLPAVMDLVTKVRQKLE